MSKKLSDFSQLKSAIKFVDAEQQTKPFFKEKPKKRSRVIDVKSKAEVAAAAEGIVPGTKVRMMETNDRGVISKIKDEYYEIESDGLVFRAVRSEFVVTDVEEDYLLLKSVAPKDKINKKQKHHNPTEDLTIDLHLDKIPGSDGVPEWAALEYQMNYFRQILRSNLKHKGKKIVFIHGVGDGILASSVRCELDEVFAVSCRYNYNSPDITTVFVK